MDTFKAEIKKMIALFNNNLNVSLIEFLDKLSLYKKIKVQIIVCIFICLFLINGCQKDYLYSDVFIEGIDSPLKKYYKLLITSIVYSNQTYKITTLSKGNKQIFTIYMKQLPATISIVNKVNFFDAQVYLAPWGGTKNIILYDNQGFKISIFNQVRGGEIIRNYPKWKITQGPNAGVTNSYNDQLCGVILKADKRKDVTVYPGKLIHFEDGYFYLFNAYYRKRFKGHKHADGPDDFLLDYALVWKK